MHDLSRFLEDQLQIPILDETNLTTCFDLTLAYSVGDIDALNRALSKNGLQLVDAKRPIDMLVIYDK